MKKDLPPSFPNMSKLQKALDRVMPQKAIKVFELLDSKTKKIDKVIENWRKEGEKIARTQIKIESLLLQEIYENEEKKNPLIPIYVHHKHSEKEMDIPNWVKTYFSKYTKSMVNISETAPWSTLEGRQGEKELKQAVGITSYGDFNNLQKTLERIEIVQFVLEKVDNEETSMTKAIESAEIEFNKSATTIRGYVYGEKGHGSYKKYIKTHQTIIKIIIHNAKLKNK